MEKDIIIKGAREHNLKNIDVNTTRKACRTYGAFGLR